jgi:uncharacterized protein YecE (DUF72 family)
MVRGVYGRRPVRRVRIGCSGWQYADWRGTFYPEKLPQRRWLEHYAGRFDTVEVNNTFYRLPAAEAVARWVEQTPPEFCFTVKVSRYATHMKRLTTVADSSRRLMERVQPLVDAGRMGPWLWQLPATFRRDDDRLDAALSELPPGRHTIEFRDPSWFAEPVWELLRRHGVAAAIGHDKRRPLPDPPLTADWTLIRFHYGELGRRGNYSARELRAWAARIDDLRQEAEVLAYFNNDWEGFAPRNAVALQRLLGDT